MSLPEVWQLPGVTGIWSNAVGYDGVMIEGNVQSK